jgi:transposase
MIVGIDAHKKNCIACIFDDRPGGSKKKELLTFPTTRSAVTEFMDKIPERSILVIESSTTGKTLSSMLSARHEVHMVAPPERKPSIKTDKRDAERIVKEDMLGYLRRCYTPSQYIEGMRFTVSQQIQMAEKIVRVKDQIHALLERNMLQSEFAEFSDLFGVQGLEKLSQTALPRQDAIALAMYLEELKLYIQQHQQLETEIAKIAEADQDCMLLMSHPGIASFTAVAIKSRIGDDASRFPTKKHLCSYAGVVPGADNTGERVSDHAHVKRGDAILKYALTCAVQGAVKARAPSGVKRIYLRLVRRGKDAQQAEVAAARKLACVVWKMLTTKERYVEEAKYLTARKMTETSYKARRRVLSNVATPERVTTLIRDLTAHTDVLERYPEEMRRGMLGHHRGRRSSSSSSSSSDGKNERASNGGVEK